MFPIDAIIGKEQVNFAVILPKLFTCAVLIGCAALAQWLMNVCGNKVTYNTIRDMREAAFKKNSPSAVFLPRRTRNRRHRFPHHCRC